MPRIPDKEILGDRPALPVDRSVQSPQHYGAPLQAGIEGLSKIGAAAGRVGQAIESRAVAIQQVGEKVSDWGVKQKAKYDDDALVNAKMQWIKDNIEIDSSFDTDTDYANYTTKYKKATGEAMTRTMAILNGVDPDVRNKFLQTLEMDVLRGSASIERKRLDGWRDARAANLGKISDDAMLEAAKLSHGDHRNNDLRNTGLAAIHQKYDGVPGSEETKQNEIAKFQENFSKQNLHKLPPRERLRELTASSRPWLGKYSADTDKMIMGDIIDKWGSKDVINDNKGQVTPAFKDVDLGSLTRDGAINLLTSHHSKEINSEFLSPEMRYIVSDTAVLQGAPMAMKILRESGNDPVKYTEIRRQEIAKLDPTYQNGWIRRANYALDRSGAVKSREGDFLKSPGSWQREFDGAVAELKKEANDAVGIINTHINSASKGYGTPDEDKAAIYKFGAEYGDFPEVVKKVEYFKYIDDLASNFKMMNLAEMEEAINTKFRPLANLDGATDIERGLLEFAVEFKNNAEEQIKDDTVSWAVQQGMLPNGVRPLDIDDVSTFTDRGAIVNDLSKKFDDSTFFTKAETPKYKKLFTDANTDPGEIVAKMARILETQRDTPSNQWRIVKEATEDNSNLAYAANMLRDDPSDFETPTMIITGERINAIGKTKRSNQFYDAMVTSIGGADGLIGEHRDAFRMAVQNIYTSLGGDISSETVDDKMLKQAISRAAGGDKQDVENTGVSDVYGAKTWLPRGVTSDRFKTAISQISTDDFVDMAGGGYLYDVQGNRINASDIHYNGKFVAVNRDKTGAIEYKIRMNDGGYVMRADKKEFIVPLDKKTIDDFAFRAMIGIYATPPPRRPQSGRHHPWLGRGK